MNKNDEFMLREARLDFNLVILDILMILFMGIALANAGINRPVAVSAIVLQMIDLALVVFVLKKKQLRVMEAKR